jgi:hypothetical protein
MSFLLLQSLQFSYLQDQTNKEVPALDTAVRTQSGDEIYIGRDNCKTQGKKNPLQFNFMNQREENYQLI